MEKKKLYCYSYNEFKELVKNSDDLIMSPNTAIISVTGDWDGNEHLLSDSDRVLNLTFDDTDPQVLGLPDFAKEGEFDGKYVKLFDEYQADEAVDFITNNLGKDFVIHCAAGKSRSQAFVRFIIDEFPMYEWETRAENRCMFPNHYVVFLLKHNLRVKKYKDIEDGI
jgi:predicted protein tyrosine phosphatase